MAGRNQGFFEPLGKIHKAKLIGSVLLCLTLYVIIMVPLGWCMATLLALVSMAWRKIGDSENLTLPSFYPTSKAYKAAAFFTTLNLSLRDVYSPKVSLGFGTPTPDMDHKLEPGWFPFSRLSSYWCLAFALLASGIEFAAPWAHYPFWGPDLKIPAFILYVLGIPGWFMAAQVVLAVFRIRGGFRTEDIISDEPMPAVMIHKSKAEIPVREVVIHSLAWSAVLPVAILIFWSIGKWDFLYTIIAIAISLPLVALAKASRMMQIKYNEGWEMRRDRRMFWSSTFAFMKAPPAFLNEVELPSFEEWLADHPEFTPEEVKQKKREYNIFKKRNKIGDAPGEEADWDGVEEAAPAPQEDIGGFDEGVQEGDGETYVPLVNMATFQFAPNCTFETYRGLEEQIRGNLDVSNLAIAPIGNFDQEGQEVAGTVGAQGFRLWYSKEPLPHILEPEMNPWTREFLVRSVVIPAISGIRSLGYCALVKYDMITRRDSESQVLEVIVKPISPNVNLDSFLSSIPDLQRILGVGWVRADVASKQARTDKSVIKLYIGDKTNEKTKFKMPSSIIRNKIIPPMDWAYYFNSTGVSSRAGGTPTFKEKKKATPVVDKLVFSVPDGLSYEAIEAAISRLKTTSGNSYMEISQGDDSDLSSLSTTERARRESEAGASFTMIASVRDPLERVFEFDKYTKQILPGRTPGVAKIDWSPGVLADDQLAIDSWDDNDAPHLLVAGASGSGKSVTMSSMILQIMHNNSPKEAVFWMVEPKNEMQIYRHSDNVERFVDSWSPDENFISNVADMMEDAVAEMNRRNKLFVNHPKSPKKLAKARQIAMSESKAAGTPPEQHPLYMPFIFIILEECASLFAEAASKEERGEQARLTIATAEIARKARSAGIHLIAATQYPTNASIPSVIRQQMRRIGMKCMNSMSSTVVIDQTGLEKIKIKGAGMIKVKGQYRNFRGFWVKDDPDDDTQNDIVQVLKRVPQRQPAGVGPGMSPTGGGAVGSGGVFHPEVVAPSIPNTVFNKFSRSGLADALSKATDLPVGRKTKDKTDRDVPSNPANLYIAPDPADV